MAKEAIDAVSTSRDPDMLFDRTPEGRIDQRRFGGHTRDHGKAPVRSAPATPPTAPATCTSADAVPKLRQARRRVLQRVLTHSTSP